MVALAPPLDPVRAGDDWPVPFYWHDDDGDTPAALTGYTFAAWVSWPAGNIALPPPTVDLDEGLVMVIVPTAVSETVPPGKLVQVLLEYTDPLGLKDSILQPFSDVLEKGR